MFFSMCTYVPMILCGKNKMEKIQNQAEIKEISHKAAKYTKNYLVDSVSLPAGRQVCGNNLFVRN
jgi:hypothetical protein